MNLGAHRIAIATVLAAAAVVVPCSAWYYAGSRAAAKEAVAARDEPHARGWEAANALAERLAGRLEAIRAAESRRPWYHYQDQYHDPTSSCSCASLTPSPLATGPSDPLLLAHFQIDPEGTLALPSLHTDPPPPGTGAWYDEQTVLRTRLQATATACQRAAGVSAVHVVTQDLRLHADDPTVTVGTFGWVTLPVGSDSSLVALRRVESSLGSWVQGFLLNTNAVTRSLRPATYPVTFVPDDGRVDIPRTVKAPVQLEGAECAWVVALDVGEAAEEAEVRAATIVSTFHRTFAVGSSAAFLAGVLLVWLIWKTERLGRQRSRFAASAAHELRTPLAGLRLYGDMLSEHLGDPDRSRDYARKISQEAERLGRVVTNVLGFSHLERGTLQCAAEVGDLEQALRECLQRVAPALEAAGARVELHVDEDLPAARFDREALFHIVQNLLDNAEKYSRLSADRTIEVGLTHVDSSVRLTVADHGPGIPEGFRSHLFEPFRRAEQRDAPPGLGLGLALVRALTRAQEGRVSFTNGKDGGAVFRVSFPAA
jgi:signal transduction histidine kinase